MTLIDDLRAEVVRRMKRRDTVGLRALRDAISAIQNAETSYVSVPGPLEHGTDHVAGAVPFGHAERVVEPLSAEAMMTIAREEVARRLAEADRYRGIGQVDRALTLKAEALVLADALDAYPG